MCIIIINKLLTFFKWSLAHTIYQYIIITDNDVQQILNVLVYDRIPIYMQPCNSAHLKSIKFANCTLDKQSG